MVHSAQCVKKSQKEMSTFIDTAGDRPPAGGRVAPTPSAGGVGGPCDFYKKFWSNNNHKAKQIGSATLVS